LNPLVTSAVEQGIFRPAFDHEHWAKELESSAISPGAAEGWLYWTDNKRVLVDLGLDQRLLGVAGKGDEVKNHWMVRIMRDHRGQDYAIEAKPRFPGGNAKYVSPKGHSGADVRVSNDQSPLFIVEGGKKAAALASLGCDVIAINGCWGWGSKRDEELKRMKQKALHPHIASVITSGRIVYILLDADITTNPNVNLAARSLFSLLNSLEARVAVMQVPYEGDETRGVDDLLAEVEEKGRPGIFKLMVKRALQEVPPMTAEAEAALAEDRGCYTTEKGEPITNFTVEVQRETVVLNNDSLVQDRTADIVIHPQRGETPLPLTVRTELLRDGKIWPSHLIPMRFNVQGAGPTFGNLLFNEIMAHQADYEIDSMYGFLGWLKDRYLLPNGTIGPAGDEGTDSLGVRLFEEGESAPWGSKALMVPPEDTADAERSILAMLDLVKVFPPQLLLAPFGATLETAEIHWWLHGMTSRGKTHTAMILQSFWGPQHSDMVQQFSNITESAFGTTASKVPGLLFVLDDAVNSMGLDRDSERKLNKFIRQAFGSGGGYQKGTRSGTGTRTLGSIRTSLLFTAEALVGGESFRNRLIHVAMPTEGFLNWEEHGVDVERNRRDGTYAKAMYQWLTWLASHGGAAWGRDQLKARVNINTLTSHRANETTSKLLALVDLWSLWLGPIAETAAEQMREAIMDDAHESEAQHRKDVGLAVQFTDLVSAMLLDRDYKVNDLTNQADVAIETQYDMGYIFEGSRTIGWADTGKGMLYIDKAALRWILQRAREEGRVLSGVVDNVIGKGIISTALDNEYEEGGTVRVRLPGRERERLWAIPLHIITGG
jgi:hypothetical protein